MESTTWISQQSADDLLNDIHRRFVGAKHVDSVSRTSPTTLDVAASAHPAWTIFLAILLFPIGLVFLLMKSKHQLRFWAQEVDGQTHLHVDGSLAPGTKAALIEVYNDLTSRGVVTGVAA